MKLRQVFSLLFCLSMTPLALDADMCPQAIKDLVHLPEEDLAKMDIARVNLICAEGLPGSEKIDVEASLKKMDAWAEGAKRYIAERQYDFFNNPGKYEYSRAIFYMNYLMAYLVQEIGVAYNPARIRRPGEAWEPNERFFADSKDIFIHGFTARAKPMGTCSNLPVLYVAIGRRLGYPVYLAATKGHTFVRWVDPLETVNFDEMLRRLDRRADCPRGF